MDDDPVKGYLREACAIPALTRDEEIELSQHVLARAGRRLIEANLAMVVSIAEGYRDADMHVLDLIQKGNDGLLLTLNTFAGDSVATFSAHAANCVENAISRALAESRRR